MQTLKASACRGGEGQPRVLLCAAQRCKIALLPEEGGGGGGGGRGGSVCCSAPPEIRGKGGEHWRPAREGWSSSAARQESAGGDLRGRRGGRGRPTPVVHPEADAGGRWWGGCDSSQRRGRGRGSGRRRRGGRGSGGRQRGGARAGAGDRWRRRGWRREKRKESGAWLFFLPCVVCPCSCRR